MKGSELEPILQEIGWDRKRLTDELKINKNTYTNWILGHTPIPRGVSNWLMLKLANKRLGE